MSKSYASSEIINPTLHHVGLTAAVGDDAVDAAVFLEVLAHVVDADVHQLDALESAAAFFRAARGMGRQAGEL